MQSPTSLLEKGRGRFDCTEGKVMLKQDAGLLALKMEEGPGAKGCEECGSRSCKRRANASHLEPPEGGPHSDFSLLRPVLDSDTQECMRINCCHFKSLRLW